MKRMNRIAAAVSGLALAGAGVLVIGTGSAAASPASAGAPPGGPVPAGFEVASVTFVSANEGWVLGTTKTCAQAPCTSVLRTTDGGHTWVGIPAPKYRLVSPTSESGLQRLRFADPSDGFAFGTQLWVTHNGGSSWYRVTQVPGVIVDLETAAGVVYAVSANTKTNKETVYSSPAARDSWHRVAGLPVTSGYGGLGLITLHGKAGWFILGGRLYATTNGSSWVKESFTCPGELMGLTSVGAYSATRISLLCSGNPGLGSTEKAVYVSTDGGAHFTKAGTPGSGGDGGLLAEPTPQHLFIATASGATWLYVSTNGGRTWHNNLTLIDGGLGWYDFGFTTATQGVAVEGEPALGSHLWITWNAGKKWHKVTF